MLVVNREQVELTPIENAIDTVNLQTSRLQAEVKKPVPDVKTLQPLLQGSCLVMVQKGMVEGICSSFLSKTLKQWPIPCIARLIVSTEQFVKAVEDGLRLHVTIVPSEMEQMHMELEKGFRRMRNEVTAMINSAREACDLVDDADFAKAAKKDLILNERITAAPQYISSKPDVVPSSSSPSLVSTRRNARPLQRRMSANISPLAIPQVNSDGTVTLTERAKRKRADSYGCVSPVSPISAQELAFTVSVPSAPVEKQKPAALEITPVNMINSAKEVTESSGTDVSEESDSDMISSSSSSYTEEEEEEEETIGEENEKKEKNKVEENVGEKKEESEEKKEKPEEQKEKAEGKEEGEKKKESDKAPSTPRSPHVGSHHHDHHRHHSSSHHSPRSPGKQSDSSKHHHKHSSHDPKKSPLVDGKEQKPSHSRRKSHKSGALDSSTPVDSPRRHRK